MHSYWKLQFTGYALKNALLVFNDSILFLMENLLINPILRAIFAKLIHMAMACNDSKAYIHVEFLLRAFSHFPSQTSNLNLSLIFCHFANISSTICLAWFSAIERFLINDKYLLFFQWMSKRFGIVNITVKNPKCKNQRNKIKNFYQKLYVCSIGMKLLILG